MLFNSHLLFSCYKHHVVLKNQNRAACFLHSAHRRTGPVAFSNGSQNVKIEENRQEPQGYHVEPLYRYGAIASHTRNTVDANTAQAALQQTLLSELRAMNVSNTLHMLSTPSVQIAHASPLVLSNGADCSVPTNAVCKHESFSRFKSGFSDLYGCNAFTASITHALPAPALSTSS
jgi:hypothetical protein